MIFVTYTVKDMYKEYSIAMSCNTKVVLSCGLRRMSTGFKFELRHRSLVLLGFVEVCRVGH